MSSKKKSKQRGGGGGGNSNSNEDWRIFTNVASLYRRAEAGNGYAQQKLAKMKRTNNEEDDDNMNFSNNDNGGDEDDDEDDEDDDDEDDEDDEEKEKEEDDDVKKYWLKQAKKGNVNAMYTLGFFKDGPRERYWLKKAAQLGHTGAKNYLQSQKDEAAGSTWGQDEQILFTEDIIADFGASVHDTDIIRRDNIFFKQEMIRTRLVKKRETDKMLRLLPCQSTEATWKPP